MLMLILKYLCCDVPLHYDYGTCCVICGRVRSVQAVVVACGQTQQLC
jgi:hypothetical protein